MLQCNDLTQYEKKLEKANKVISEIANDYKNITPIILTDAVIFEDFFAKETRHTYGDSWVYLTQGTYGIGPKKLGYKYFDGNNIAALTVHPKIEDQNILMMYWARPMGREILSIIVNLSAEIKKRYGICTYVKKLFPDQYQYLLQHGFKSAKEFPWHSSAHSEDDTYPEIIYDREMTLQIIRDATRSSSLGRVKRGVAKIKREHKIEISDHNFKENAWRVVNDYFLEREKLADKVNVSAPADYYNMIFYDHDSSVDKKILFVDGEPMGLFIVERNKKFDVANMYCCLALREHHKYLMDILKLSIFERQPSKYINSGGSEDPGMHEFKLKYKPIENIMYITTNYEL
ncbi:MAG: hypothetical protein PVI75_00285 [Gammaproteobacteria bacterium]